MEEQVIQIPDNFEVKEIKADKIILVEKEKKLTYDDITTQLFPLDKIHYYITDDGDILDSYNFAITPNCKNNAISKRQLEKLLAINMLMNVAKYLNGDWQPHWNDVNEDKYYITICYGKMSIEYVDYTNCTDIYFKSEELAEKAIDILGEDTIRLAFCTDY